MLFLLWTKFYPNMSIVTLLSLQTLLFKLRLDYAHEWPNEDEQTKKHRLELLAEIEQGLKDLKYS